MRYCSSHPGSYYYMRMVTIKYIFGLLALAGLSRRWQIAVYICVGTIVGLSMVVARQSNALSYLSESPETCMNCHVMTDAYASWQRGSHGRDTICLDCHVPHSNIIAKTAFKSMDGIKHSTVFMLKKEPQILRLSKIAQPVVQANCIRCHSDKLVMARLAASSERKCWDCHTNIHGKAHGLSASPQVLRPQLPDAGLDWMK